MSTPFRVGVSACVPIAGVIAARRPNPVLADEEVVAWGFADQRLLLFGYVGFIIGVALFGLLASVPRGRVPASVARARGGGCRRALGGAALAVALFLPSVIGRVWPNQHLDVQLGGLQRVKDGGVPLVDAITQYGPGQQWLLVRVMDLTGFSYFGALKAQTAINAVVLVCCGGLFVWFLGWKRGVVSLGLMTFFVSPVYGVASFAGWGLLNRWFGVPVVSMLSAHLLWQVHRPDGDRDGPWRAGRAAFIGIVWGVFAVCAQEAIIGGVIAVALTSGLAVACGAVSRRQAVQHIVWTVCSFGLGFTALFALLVGSQRMTDGLWLFTRYPQLVSNGVSNLRISDGFEPGFTLLKVMLVGLPVLLVLVAVSLSSGRAHRDDRSAPALRRLAGVVPAALGLSVGSYLRADVAHTEGPALMVGAIIVLLCADLPSIWPSRQVTRVVRSIAVSGACFLLLICALTPSTTAPRLLTPAVARDWAAYFRSDSAAVSTPSLSLAEGVSGRDLRFVVDRYVGNGGQFARMWDYDGATTLIETAAFVRAAAAGRTVIYYDKLSAHEAPFASPAEGGVVFLSGVRSVVPYIDRSISLWTRSDYERFAAFVPTSGAQCLVTDVPADEHDPVVDAFQLGGATSETVSLVADRWLRVLCRSSDG